MSNILEDIKESILYQIQSELETMNKHNCEIRLPRSEIIKNLSDSYNTLMKVSVNLDEKNLIHEPKPIPTETYDKGFKL